MNMLQVWKENKKTKKIISEEMENGFKYKNGNTLVWDEKMYRVMKDFFSDCAYVYTYIYYVEKEKCHYYYIDFLFQNKKIKIEISEERKTNSLMLSLRTFCANERWNKFLNKELVILYSKLEFVKKYIYSLPRYRVKHLMRNLIDENKQEDIEKEMNRRGLKAT